LGKNEVLFSMACPGKYIQAALTKTCRLSIRVSQLREKITKSKRAKHPRYM
jgi:hypothetical protein